MKITANRKLKRLLTFIVSIMESFHGVNDVVYADVGKKVKVLFFYDLIVFDAAFPVPHSDYKN